MLTVLVGCTRDSPFRRRSLETQNNNNTVNNVIQIGLLLSKIYLSFILLLFLTQSETHGYKIVDRYIHYTYNMTRCYI